MLAIYNARYTTELNSWRS